MKWRWFSALLPMLCAALIAAALARSRWHSYLIVIDGELWLGTLVLIGGLLASVLLALVLERRQRIAQVHAALHKQAATDRHHFLRRLDHELKNPVTAILAGLATLSDADLNPANRTALENTQGQTRRLSRLVTDLRKLTDLENHVIKPELVNLAELLEDAFAQAQSQPEADEREMVLLLPSAWPPLPQVSGDEDLLYLSIFNLLQNAIKFSQPGDKIELSAFGDRNHVLVKVADTGPGISSADIPHVWDELYRGSQVHHTPGSGLGLAFVRSIVARHNGQVSMISRPNEGTEVTIRLPITHVTAT